MKEKLMEIGQWAVTQARSKGISAEAFALHSEDLTVEVVDGQVETLKQSEEIGLGIRILDQMRPGFSFTTDLTRSSVDAAITRAIEAARHAAVDEANGFALNGRKYPEIYVYDPEIQQQPLEKKIEMAREVERQARAVDKRIKLIERAGYEESRYTVAIVNDNGIQAWEKAAYSGIFVFTVAEEEGDAQTGFSVLAKRRFAELDPVFVGQEGANDALRSLKARTIPSQSMPCILEPYVMTNFLGVLSSSFGSDAVQKGKSALQGKIGERIGSAQVTLVDDGTYENGLASFPFDGEGVPSQRTVLMEKGMLKAFLYDTYTAKKEGVDSTGNGTRGSFRGLPSVGTTNFYLEPGSGSAEELYRDVKRGLYITEVMGMHTANPISGDFSVGAAGIMIENGVLTYPVRGAAIAGNLFDFLMDVEGIASDLRFYGGIGSPSVRIKALSVAGE